MCHKKTIFLLSIVYFGILANNQTQHFKVVNVPLQGTVITDATSLFKITYNTYAYIKKFEKKDWAPFHNSIFSKFGLTHADVKRTLIFIMKIIKHDQGKKKQRILDPNFINKHFRCIKWSGDQQDARKHNILIPSGQIRLTKYLVFNVPGSLQKTKQFCCALYALPKDEEDYAEAFTEKNKHKFIRYRYTKQQIINGALEKHQVKPLVWLTRDGLEEALMQGTICVTLPDGILRFYNVHRNNGIPYDRLIKDKRLQKRYWYFKEVNTILGYGKDNNKVSIVPKVTFAGNVDTLGLGKLVAVQYKNPQTNHQEIRLGVLADKGGAFDNNLYQLDYFTGIFSHRSTFNNYIQHISQTVEAYILIKK